MKGLLVGLLALGSISAFAGSAKLKFKIYDESGKKIGKTVDMMVWVPNRNPHPCYTSDSYMTISLSNGANLEVPGCGYASTEEGRLFERVNYRLELNLYNEFSKKIAEIAAQDLPSEQRDQLINGLSYSGYLNFSFATIQKTKIKSKAGKYFITIKGPRALRPE